MDQKETKRFDKLYQRHLQMLKGKSEKTRDAYARAIKRLRDHFDCCPDKLTPKQLEAYFAQLVDTHSWSTVKVDCWGFKFFWKFVLEKDWQWINIVKPPKVKSLPDILTPFPSPQLCHPSSGARPEPASYPGPFGSCQSEHNRTIRPTHPDL